jgi:hypothetical protein
MGWRHHTECWLLDGREWSEQPRTLGEDGSWRDSTGIGYLFAPGAVGAPIIVEVDTGSSQSKPIMVWVTRGDFKRFAENDVLG